MFMWPISIAISYTHEGDCVYVAYISIAIFRGTITW